MKRILGMLVAILVLGTVNTSCGTNGVAKQISDTSTPTDYRVEKLEGKGTINYELNNLNGESVYFIFTNEKKYIQPTDDNSTPNNTVAGPTITKSINVQKNLISKNSNVINYTSKKSNERGSKEIDALNNEIAEKLKNLKPNNHFTNKSIGAFQDKQYSYLVGITKEPFKIDDNGNTVQTTLRKVKSAHGKNLYIWVADDAWIGGTRRKLVNQEMLDIYADKFLNANPNADIYEWVTSIVGEPWGDVPTGWGGYFIPKTNDIHILMYDIDNDNSIDGGTLGYYSALNNLIKSADLAFTANSNEKLMFVIDSVMFATDDSALTSNAPNTKWEITDYWPEEMVSTLAHEFQHMVHFYQKTIKNINETKSNLSETWLNELASLSMEDLVSQKILSNGPRGIDYNDMTAGVNWIRQGRLVEYNEDNDIPITAWGGYGKSKDTLPSYAINYAFGAYLMRNYGGVNFIKELVQNSKLSTDAIDTALKNTGYNVTFNEVLRNFAIANLLSDKTEAPNNFKYNIGGAFGSNINGITYNLGSINLYNYINQPKIYDVLPSSLNNTSNTYYNGGKNLIGNNKWTISNLDPNIKVTVVIKK